MTATNHALTGAVIGLAVGNAWLVIPAAFVSHFALDALPHFGVRGSEAKWLRSKRFRALLILDMTACLALVLALFLNGGQHWFLAAACAFTATTPDLFWIERLIKALKKRPLLKEYKNPFKQLHSKIQWFALPPGLIVEGVWASAAIIVLVKLLQD